MVPESSTESETESLMRHLAGMPSGSKNYIKLHLDAMHSLGILIPMIDSFMFAYMPFGLLHFLGSVLWWMFIVTGTLAFMKYLGHRETVSVKQVAQEPKPVEKVVETPPAPKETGLVMTEEVPLKKRPPRRNEKVAGV